MKILLDTYDMINLFKNSEPSSADEFEESLRAGGHVLVLSWSVLYELCRPLRSSNTKTNVMRTINRIEQMPHLFVWGPEVERLELEEAISSYRARIECAQIDPLFPRITDILPGNDRYKKMSLSEIIFNKWMSDSSTFRPPRSEDMEKTENMAESDRINIHQMCALNHLILYIKKSFKEYSIDFPSQKIASISSWIFESPMRCPGMRLGLETDCKWLSNKDQKPKKGDVFDVSNIACIPYVDLATFDKNWRNLIRQASVSLKLNYHKKLLPNWREVFDKLKSDAA